MMLAVLEIETLILSTHNLEKLISRDFMFFSIITYSILKGIKQF